MLLTEFVIKEGFTAKRLEDAVNHVITNFQFKELNISDIVRFDRRVKLHTYNEVCNSLERGYIFGDYENKDVNGKIYWVLKTDLAKL